MQFPFIPGGLFLALMVLGISLVAFGLALKSLDWSIDTARRSAIAGIVTGLRTWQSRPDAAQVAPPSTELEESVGALGMLEPVAPDGTHRRREG